MAGKRKGLAGERSGLFFEFMRLVAEVAPRWVVIENVPGLLTSGHRSNCDDEKCVTCSPGADMGAVLWALAELGYGWAYRVLDAQFFGVAQRRRRVFIVGCLGDGASAASVLFEPESCDGNPPPRREAGSSTPRPVANSLGGVGGGQDFAVGKGDLVIAKTLTSGSATGKGVNPPGRRGEDDYNLVVGQPEELDLARALTAERGQRLGSGNEGNLVFSIYPESGQGADLVAREIPDDEAGPTMTGVGYSSTSDRGMFVTAYRKAQKAHDSDDCERWEEADTSQTLDAGGHTARTATAVLEDQQAVRRLTPVECERLQGFPDGWTSSLADSGRYRTLGNAVAVPVSEWIGRRMMEVHGAG